MNKQVKSKKRISDHGEVFTSEREVKAMLDLVKQETERIDSRFLEPACGNGNFLAEVLKRKLAIVEAKYKKSQLKFELYAVVAISSIYGVDILEDNAQECRERLFLMFNKIYSRLYKRECKEECRNSVKFLLTRNILWGDALDFSNPETREPIIFSEWSAVKGNMLKRRDYVFKFLVEQTHQFSIFNEEGKPAAINEPVKDFPLVHFLKISSNA
ncbi:DNA methyltransferase [Christiangramia sabulilitoris]|uniref:SAM-dependent DNA methyltransferase n=1 Tax=Christiangramia sabulilitoris TaxID=2583991 RepID=A0A550I7L8_9FLAO|nr:DNA methyltransferase [Christiangramia sabulilitoris]TRO66951.1 SAM-dependent DNA methyltransferase [Christiangramia sabulilitoris]